MTATTTVRRLGVPALTAAVLTALLADSKCACGQAARRLTVERDPVTPPAYSARRKVTAQGVKVTAWCGDVETHADDWDDDSTGRYGQGRCDPDDVAMTESDL